MVLVKTEIGQNVLKDRSTPLTPRQRAAFILFDGKKSVDQVMAATAGMAITFEDIDHLIQAGLLAEVATATVELLKSTRPAKPVSGRSDSDRYQDAYKVATQLTSTLGLRGFRLNLAVEAAQGFDELLALAPKIRDAVGDKAFLALDQALND